jgi:hypothetical protein
MLAPRAARSSSAPRVTAFCPPWAFFVLQQLHQAPSDIKDVSAKLVINSPSKLGVFELFFKSIECEKAR